MIIPHFNISNTISIENYDVLEKIGEGGYGLIYKAIKQSTGQTVAIKTIKHADNIGEQNKKQLLLQFHQETELCENMTHPNIVKLLDKGQTKNGIPYAVFEYVKGHTLKAFILQNGCLSAITMSEIMEQVLSALIYAHNKGIIHRDLKPQNIMISKIGIKHQVKILDFGISTFKKNVRRSKCQHLNLNHNITGTPMYCAPEQLKGEPPTLQSDIYAWGLIVLECLTGQPVMSGTSQDVILQQQLKTVRIPLPQALNNHQLATLLHQVLEKNPKNRAESCSQVFQDFRQINFKTLTGNLASCKHFNGDYHGVTLGNDMALNSLKK